MKALTVKEPWASLIVNGYKKYEFRSWKTNYRGKILIHAGKTIEKDMLSKFNDYNISCYSGEIIGEAYITDCILIDDAFQDELNKTNMLIYGRSSHVGIYAWKLENVVKYDKPIKAKGKLGLWNCDIEEVYVER